MAAALVFAYHSAQFCSAGSEQWIERTYCRLASAGWTGVDLFFVLSGYLITGILVDTRDRARYFVTFYVRRALRILPLFYAVVALVALGPSSWREASPSLAWVASQQAWFWSYLQNWLMISDQGPAPGWLGHFWSLAIEEQFYLVWPLVVWAVSRRSLAWLCGSLVLASLATRLGLAWLFPGDTAIVYFNTMSRLDGLSAGALLALLHRQGDSRTACRRFALVSLAGGLSLVVATQKMGGAGLLPALTFDLSALNVLFAAVVNVAVLRSETRWARWLSHPALCWLGQVSYGFYVFHRPIILMAVPVFPLMFGDAGGYPLVRQLVFTVLTAVLSVLCALVSWHLLEKPFLALKRHFPSPGPATA